MKNYFKISEFAKLRNININSLRYYEKLGLLKPAYIDEKTNYRYYTAEQISVLNNIILCINLGIPLKEMTKYIDENGNLQSQRLLEQGKIVAQKRIEEMKRNLDVIEYSLKNLERSKEFVSKRNLYRRDMDARRIIVSDYFTGTVEVKKMLFEVAHLYTIAQENELAPILPAGQLLQFTSSGKIRYRFFLEIVDQEHTHPRIITLPKGEYSCMQVDLKPSTDLAPIVGENWGYEEDATIIVYNVILEKYSFGSRPSELQKLEI